CHEHTHGPCGKDISERGRVVDLEGHRRLYEEGKKTRVPSWGLQQRARRRGVQGICVGRVASTRFARQSLGCNKIRRGAYVYWVRTQHAVEDRLLVLEQGR